MRLTVLQLLLLGCSTTPPPHEQLATARAMVAQAQPVVAQAQPVVTQAQPVAVGEGAPELKTAQVKLTQAEEAMQRFEYRNARILAEQAEVDARYAWTAAESARLRRAAAQLERRPQ